MLATKRPSFSRSIIAQYQTLYMCYPLRADTGRQLGKMKTDRAAAAIETRATRANRTTPAKASC
jgi:hypothetical protein